jgi:hypothetical protein
MKRNGEEIEIKWKGRRETYGLGQRRDGEEPAQVCG